jgi:hypothetical protein
MADITMCEGRDCPLKDHCYRHLASPSQRQSFFLNMPYNAETKTCDLQIPHKKP